MTRAEELAYKFYPVPEDNNPTIHQQHSFGRQGFLLGYHQAEKDIGDPISWIKEISGVKEMTRAKEEALKAYPPRSIAANYDTINRRDAFEYGYIKAEKDLSLTWEDLKLLWQVRWEMPVTWEGTEEEWYKELLKRFNEKKKLREE